MNGQSRAATSQVERKQRQLEKIMDENDVKWTGLQNELKDSQDESRALTLEISKLRLLLDESESGVDMVKKDNKKLAGW
jgi:regulator of replication initiation timing